MWFIAQGFAQRDLAAPRVSIAASRDECRDYIIRAAER
jgi:hypothetical protein